MFKITASIVALALASTQVSAQATVNSINPTQCQPVAITWTGASGDVFLSIVQGMDTSASPLRKFPTQSGASGSFPWTVDVPAGTQITLIINDGTGVPNFSGSATVAAGQDSCNPTLEAGAASVSGASSAASSTDAAATSTTDAAATSMTSSAASPSSAGSSSKTSGTASSASSAAQTSNDANGATDIKKMNSGFALTAVAGLIGASFALF